MRLMRLKQGDNDLARDLFSLMAEIFEEECEVLSDAYLNQLLTCEAFWVIAAFDGDQIIGGVTAHTLPMTRRGISEVFIYDIAVRIDHQRKGIGRHLVQNLQNMAAASGIWVLFVSADNDDLHALDFYRALGGVASPVTFFTFTHCHK
jgi:aminoglycoside 3-N-acetyltransferase I